MNRLYKLGKWIFYERGLQDESTKSKINEFDFDFTEKLKIEQRGIFQNVNRKSTKIKNKIT